MPATLKVLTGPMFSGKSEELIRLIKRHTYAHKRIVILKPKNDTRQVTIRARAVVNNQSVVTAEIPAFAIQTRDEAQAIIDEYIPDVLAIDEGQFFDPWLADFVRDLLFDPRNNLTIYVVGLDMDAWGRSFGPIGELLVMADEVVKMTAICFRCGNPATMTIKKVAKSNDPIQPGDIELYEARCRFCWRPPTH